MTTHILHGDCLAILPTLPERSVHCVVTSPPYYGLRDYGVKGQHGLEKTPEEFIANAVKVFAEVKRVLRDDGTLWLNIGDSYVLNGGAGWQGKNGARAGRRHTQRALRGPIDSTRYKAKDMYGIPWMLAFALRADGWYLRQDIIWAKPNPMPESCKDRCTKAHEYLFLLTKSARYYYDHAAIQEPASHGHEARWAGDEPGLESSESHAGTGKSTRRFAKGIGGWAAGDGNNHSATDHAQGDRKDTHAAAVKNQITDKVSARMGRGAGWRQRAEAPAGVPENNTRQSLFRDEQREAARNNGVGWGHGTDPKPRTVGTKHGNRASFRGGGVYTDHQAFDNDTAVQDETHGNQPSDTLMRAKRSVWSISTAPFREAHFATFPPDLVEPCILAGTSARGCCPECGAPWRRKKGAPIGFDANGRPCPPNSPGATGWEPLCAHEHPPVPCTVLDPYGGAGTVGLVADRHQRRAILIELKPEYAAIAKRRIEGDAPLLSHTQPGL